MATVIGVRFKKAGKVYYFDPNEFWPKPGENVVVETARGLEFGEVVTGARTVADEQIVTPLKKVVRIATEEDIRNAELNAKREQEAFRICQEKVALHKLDMKLVSVEYTFDNSKIIFYFTADGRVDFRELVKDLAGVFKMRIELRQIGVRDEAKMLGGLGSCGRNICCGAFLGDFQPVSIKMAKEQNLSLNPTKISGLCGRLMCCLKYEQDTYEATLKRVPKVGKDIVTPDGVGVLAEINAIRETVKVRVRVSDENIELREYAIDDVRRPGPGDAAAVRDVPKPQERKPRNAEAEEKNEEQDENQRRRYPRPKVDRTMSTEQFLEKMSAEPEEMPEEEEAVGNEETAEKAEGQPHKRRRRGGRGHHRGEHENENTEVNDGEERPNRGERRGHRGEGENGEERSNRGERRGRRGEGENGEGRSNRGERRGHRGDRENGGERSDGGERRNREGGQRREERASEVSTAQPEAPAE